MTSAQTAELEFRSSAITGSVTLEIAGNDGVDVLTFTDGTTASAIAFAVNRISDSTGVTAVLATPPTSTSGITVQDDGYGSQSFVSVTAQNGTFATEDTAGAAKTRVGRPRRGRDRQRRADRRRRAEHQAEHDHARPGPDARRDFGAGQTEFAITGGGALFQLGPQVTSNQQVNIGIGSVAASKLGDNNVGFLNDIVTGGGNTLVGGNAAEASKIIETAIRQVAVLRGRLGAFEQNTLETNMNSPVGRAGKRHGQREHDPRRRLRHRDGRPDPRPDPDAGRHQRAGHGQHHAAERAVAAAADESSAALSPPLRPAG